MTTPVWTAGTLYAPGALVRPASTPPVVATPPTNANFEAGNTGWTLGSGWSITNSPPYRAVFDGTYAAYCSYTGTSYIANSAVEPVLPGQTITASCQASQTGTADYNNRGWVGLRWLDSGMVEISISIGNKIEQTSSGTPWRQSSVTATAPANAAFVQLVGGQSRDSGSGQTGLDAFTWDYSFSSSPDAVVYRATQAASGFSGSTEPVWPGFSLTVVDNEVTWEGVDASRVVWEASPILVSGATEPTFPTSVGGTVLDNTIIWVATTGYVEQAPQSKIVAIAAKKIFAGDDDIVKFCATINPLDWTSAEDAGYLPTGINTHGANPCAALALYRGNLIQFNSAGFQMWQVDPDPNLMALLDAVPIGSTYHRAAQPVMNDLLFLTNLGVRNISIAGGSTNLQGGSYGEAIDTLVVAAIKTNQIPNSIYYPAHGQYWLWFGDEVFVLTFNGSSPTWSRYVFPEEITDATLLNEKLYLRTAAHKVWLIDEDTLVDDYNGPATGVPFEGVIHWPHLDLGNLGVTKQMLGFDIVCTGTVSVQIGYDQRDPAVLTEAYTLTGDTLPGTPIPFPLAAASFSMKLTFAGGQAWEWVASNLYVNDFRGAGSTG